MDERKTSFSVIITGGVACGKSSVFRCLSDQICGKHRELFSADDCVHALYENAELRSEIADALGLKPSLKSVTAKEFRAEIRSEVVRNVVLLRKLEELLHPKVWQAFQEAGKGLKQLGGGILLAEVPLYFETDARPLAGLVIVVAASQTTQLERMQMRRFLPAGDALQLTERQLSISEKVRAADAVVWNDGSLDAMLAQAALLAQLINKRSK